MRLQTRLMDSQKAALLGNRAALLLGAHKADMAEAAVAALAARYPFYDRLPLLRAALLAHAGKVGSKKSSQMMPAWCLRPAQLLHLWGIGLGRTSCAVRVGGGCIGSSHAKTVTACSCAPGNEMSHSASSPLSDATFVALPSTRRRTGGSVRAEE